jgi:hypothetical protein
MLLFTLLKYNVLTEVLIFPEPIIKHNLKTVATMLLATHHFARPLLYYY